MASIIRVIPATIHRTSAQSSHPNSNRRTAAYARVSTDSEEQMTSYDAQVDYYTKYIKERPDWEFVGMYTDEGISAVNTKKRDGFNRMVADAMAGKMDLIVTKSVSRFARNTVDSLSTVRNLKDKGVEVFFEKENIYTFDGKGELLISIMSSIAQEESHSISTNVTWGQRKRFADGKVSMPYKRFLGYEKGEDGTPKIVENEAKIVRMIYRMFIEGKTPSAIAKNLTDNGLPTPGGKKKWQVCTVESILTNEKYKGDALLQKRFTVDFLTKKIKDNEGEVPQYYVQNSHPGIIDPDEFDALQFEIERRKKLGRPTSCQSPLSTKLVCGECGGFYGSKVWGSNTKYRRIIWQCNDKYKGDKKCMTPHVTGEEVKLEFVASFNKMMGYRNELISNCRLAQRTLSDCSEIDAELNVLRQEIEVVSELSRKSINENALTAINQEEWHKRHESYMARIRVASARVVSLEANIRDRLRRRRNIDLAISGLLSCEDSIDSFDERLWLMMVDRAVVMADGNIVFVYRDGIAGTCDV